MTEKKSKKQSWGIIAFLFILMLAILWTVPAFREKVKPMMPEVFDTVGTVLNTLVLIGAGLVLIMIAPILGAAAIVAYVLGAAFIGIAGYYGYNSFGNNSIVMNNELPNDQPDFSSFRDSV